MDEIKKHAYTTVTETPDTKATKDQIERLYCRYRFALDFCSGKDVLEVACGAGQGLGYLAKKARRVVGGDIDENNLKYAREHYKGRIELKVLDAHRLPFENGSFDVVILYEAIYYLRDPAEFVKESIRVLRNSGALIICTVNKEWADFNPSPHSYKYFSAPELFDLLIRGGFKEVRMFGESLVDNKTVKDKFISFLKKTAVTLHLIPKTMKGKEFFKRIFIGKLSPLPAEINDAMAQYSAPMAIDASSSNHSYKVLYALGRK